MTEMFNFTHLAASLSVWRLKSVSNIAIGLKPPSFFPNAIGGHGHAPTVQNLVDVFAGGASQHGLKFTDGRKYS